MKIIKKKNRGFTLMETLIYVAIIGGLVSGFVGFGVSISNSRNKIYVMEETQANSRFALNFISSKIRSAHGVIAPSAANSGSSLVLDMPGANPDLTFDVSGGILMMTEGAGTPTPVTSDETEISELSFANLSQAGERANIKIKMTVKFRNNGDVNFDYSQSVETAASVRK